MRKRVPPGARTVQRRAGRVYRNGDRVHEIEARASFDWPLTPPRTRRHWPHAQTHWLAIAPPRSPPLGRSGGVEGRLSQPTNCATVLGSNSAPE